MARGVKLSGHLGALLVAAFSPQGDRIVTAGAARAARIWDPASAEELVVLRGPRRSGMCGDLQPHGEASDHGRQRRDGQNLDRTVASPSGDQPLRKRTLSSIREATGQTSSKTAAEFP